MSGPIPTSTRRAAHRAVRSGPIALALACCVAASASAESGPKSATFPPDVRIGLYQAGAPQPPDSALVDPHIVGDASGGWTNRGFSQNSATIDIDNWVRWVESMEMEPVVTLQSVAPGDSISSPPADTVAWKQWVSDVVERYDDDGVDDMPGLTSPIRHWHVEQEWHIWWSGTVEEYLSHLAMTYTAIHRADSQARVVLIGLASQPVTLGAICFQDELDGDTCSVTGKSVDEATQLLQQGMYDIIDMHSYESWPIIASKVAWIRSVARFPAAPIWSLEAGGPSGVDGEPYSDGMNAAALVQQFAQALGNGVERYSWALFPPAPGSTFDYAPWTDMPLSAWSPYPDSLVLKPAYYTYRLLVRMLSGYTAASNVSTGSATDTLGAFIYRFQIGDSTVYVVWNSDSMDREITFHIAGAAALVTHIVSEPGLTDEDAVVEMVWPTHGTITYSVTPTPVFFKFVEDATDAPPLIGPPDGRPGPGLALEMRGSVARGGVRFRVHAAGAPPIAQVFDARGRAVCDVTATLRASPGGTFDGTWDGRDASGEPAAAGSYFLAVTPRAEHGVARPVVARFVRLAH